jgi:hypothetical protein
LEADYISFLAKVQKAAKENPVDVEFDFPWGLICLHWCQKFARLSI